MTRFQSWKQHTALAAQRSLFTVLGKLAPAIAGQWATRLFLATRRGGRRARTDVPLGATPLQVGDDGVYVWGNRGPIVVLVHGWGSDSGAMCSLVRPLRDRGFRVVAFDAPAHGANQGRQTTMTRFVARVSDVLDRFEPDAELRAIVGHSLGGLASVAALGAVRRTPRRLVMISAPSSLSEALRSFVGFWKLSPSTEAAIRGELMRSHGVPIEHWDVRTLAQRDRFPALGALVVHDRKDVFVPIDEARVVAAALGHTVRVEVTEGLGHARILADRQTTSLVADFVAEA